MPKYTLSSGLPDLPSGLTDKEAGTVIPLYRAINSVAQQLSIQTGNVQYSQADMANIDQLVGLTDGKEMQIYPKALAAIGYGNLVTLSLSAGKLCMRKATASDVTKPAHGICIAPDGVANGAYGTVLFLRGRTGAVSGTSVGTRYYLSTAGTMQTARPVAPAVLTQPVAIGFGSSGIYLDIQPPRKLNYGAFMQTNTVSAAAINTAYTIPFNTTDLSSGIALGTPTSRVIVADQGIYNFQFSLQLDKTAGGLGVFDFWPRINGADVANSNSRIKLKDNDSEMVAAWNFVFNLNAGDYFELAWAVDSTTCTLAAFTASAPHPATPSVILTVTDIA